jgi:hypothetical protein
MSHSITLPYLFDQWFRWFYWIHNLNILIYMIIFSNYNLVFKWILAGYE